MTRKDLGPAPEVDDFTRAMGARYEQPEESSAGDASSGRSRTGGSPGRPAPKTRRSWLLPVELVDAFAAAADRLHHGSGGRISKSEAQAAIIRAGLAHEPEIAAARMVDPAQESTGN